MKLFNDMVFGARFLYRHTNYTVTALLTLVLTIATTSTMFSLVNQVVLKPLPLPDPDQLVAVEITNTQTGRDEGTEVVPFPVFQEWLAAKPDDVGLTWAVIESSVLTNGDIGVYSPGYYVASNFINTIGKAPLMGRSFTDEDAGRPVLAISYDMWQQDLGADADIIGKKISLDKAPYTVVAVMPPDYLKTLEPRVRYWRPVNGFDRGGSVIARLSEDSSQGAMRQVGDLFNRILQRDTSIYTVTMVPLKEKLIGETSSGLWLLMAAVSALYLVAILNLTNLTFAHINNRAHELNTRVSLGATRIRLVMQLIMENLVLSVIAAVVSIFLTMLMLELALAIIPEVFPRKSEIHIDIDIWLFNLVLTLASGMLVVLFPAMRISDPARLIEYLKQGSNNLVSSFGSVGLRRNMIALQVGIALLLLVTVGLLLRSYNNLLDQEYGFNPERVVSGHIWRPEGYSNEEISAAFDRVLEEIRSLPEVSLVAAGSTIPMGPIATRVDPSIGYSYPGQPLPEQGEEPRASLRTVTDDYFRVLNIPLITGRFFDGREKTGDNPAIIINRALADIVWPQDDGIIGKELKLRTPGNWVSYIVIGIVDNYRFEDLSAEIKPEVFLSMSQAVFGGASYIARVRPDNAEVTMQTISRIASRLDSSMPMIELHSMEDLVLDSVGDRKSVLVILIGFALFATLLAGVGIYGLTSYLIGCRNREIAIRMALGANRYWIRNWVIKDAMLPACLGILIGLVLAVPLTRVIGSFLYGIDTWDWQVWTAALIFILVVALLAPVGPAIRAARVEPNSSLRSE